jgi:hypothetical protein
VDGVGVGGDACIIMLLSSNCVPWAEPEVRDGWNRWHVSEVLGDGRDPPTMTDDAVGAG